MAEPDADKKVREKDADGEDEEGTEEPGSKKKFAGKKLILFVILPLVLILGGGAGAYFGGFLDSFLGKPPAQEKKVEKKAIFYDLPDLLVNLNSSGGKNNYLKISISLQVEDKEQIDVIESLLPRVIDNFQVYLRQLRVEDLRGSAGIARLREQLLRRVNAAVKPAKVEDVLFREILIQ